MRLRGSRTLADEATESGMGETAVRVTICDLHAPKTCPKEGSAPKWGGETFSTTIEICHPTDQDMDVRQLKEGLDAAAFSVHCSNHPCFTRTWYEHDVVKNKSSPIGQVGALPRGGRGAADH